MSLTTKIIRLAAQYPPRSKERYALLDVLAKTYLDEDVVLRRDVLRDVLEAVEKAILRVPSVRS
ncbi:hypothetical protein D6833_12730 [Candidatus Parcubacteria bacterium]|nr:MAG: hypothetical protein D6833_12730 [Candidatus Parcubacteria bacterium]